MALRAFWHSTVDLSGNYCYCLLSGYMSMTDDWFTEYVLEVVVDKKHIPAAMLDILSQQPKVLPAWDPMGALAGQHSTCTCGTCVMALTSVSIL